MATTLTITRYENCSRVAFARISLRVVSSQLAYLLIGGVLGLFYATLPIALTAFDITSVMVWTFGYFLMAVALFVSGSSRWLRYGDREITNKMLGTTVLSTRSTINSSACPLWRRLLGLSPGYPAWRATLWFFFRAVFGLLTFGMVTLVILLPFAILPKLLETAPLSSFDLFLSTTGSIALAVATIVISLLVVIAWTYLPVKLLVDSASALLGPSFVDQDAELRERVHQLVQRDLQGHVLHDKVGSNLVDIFLQASAARCEIRTDPEFVHQALQDIETAARAAHKQVKGMISSYTEWVDDTESATRADLESFIRSICRYGLTISADISGEFDKLPNVVRKEVLHMVQEGCYNVYHHADGASTHVTVAIEKHELEVKIANDPPANSSSHDSANGSSGSQRGLSNIRQRIEALDGSFTQGSQPDGGYLLKARIPLS